MDNDALRERIARAIHKAATGREDGWANSEYAADAALSVIAEFRAVKTSATCPLCHGSGLTEWSPVGGGPVAIDACPICEDDDLRERYAPTTGSSKSPN